ncbi:MAG: UbiH/UbiF family hydroxylase, partial [Roseicyclus sp.]|nr:UbiH/UbiF family hydroxylase [Roseicyclus sp.]
YTRARHTEVKARVTGVDALNRASMADGQGVRDMRLRALNGLYSVAPVRRLLMRAGLGVTG